MDKFDQQADIARVAGSGAFAPSWPKPGGWVGPYAGVKLAPAEAGLAGLSPELRNAIQYQRTREMSIDELL
ncbi:MAG: hypothetical protein L0Y42_06710, partial [Phycisphaerales bacterium]|nr:hypothetical protein [Phycisphaerales bacterium]